MALQPAEKHEYRYREEINGVLQAFTTPAPCLAEWDNGDNTITIPVGDKKIAIGDLQVRLMAFDGNNAGDWLLSDAVFTKVPITPPAPTNGIVDDTADTFTFTKVNMP